MMPAPTVSLVSLSMIMNAPNLLFSRYGVNGTDLSKLTFTVAISFKPNVLAARCAPVLISNRCLMCVIVTLRRFRCGSGQHRDVPGSKACAHSSRKDPPRTDQRDSTG